MAWDIRNNWADIAELRIDDAVTDSGFTTETEFRLELYTSSHELNLEERRVLVGFNRVTLHLECHGTEIALGDRYGDNTPENDVQTKTAIQTDSTTNTGVEVGVKLDTTTALSGIPLTAGASGAAARSTSTVSETLKVSKSSHVTAKPNGKWEINSLDAKAPLAAKYLTKEHLLCVVKPKGKSNRTGVHVHLTAHKHDLVITSQDEKKSVFSLTNNENKNKEKVFKTLLSKAMDDGKEGLDPKSYVQLSMITSFDAND